MLTSSRHPPVPDMAWLTRADGSYKLTVPPGTYTIMANLSDRMGHEARGEVRGVEVVGVRAVTADITVEVTDWPWAGYRVPGGDG
ncbi:MAG TPA: hypothetical protein VG317_22160 [Pseudonocardiaceae bacterium]|jgi:hypothetical protein|nr:hypothetical protein [Pseudonocardiaceae bacterium]